MSRKIRGIKIYAMLGVEADPITGRIYDWWEYSYNPKEQPMTGGVELFCHQRNCKVITRTVDFELDPVFDPKRHNNLCSSCYFTTKEKLLEFYKTGLLLMAEQTHKKTHKFAKKLHFRVMN